MKRFIALAAAVLTMLGVAAMASLATSGVAHATTVQACIELNDALSDARGLVVGVGGVTTDSRDSAIKRATDALAASTCGDNNNGDTANTCSEYNSRGIYDIPRGDSRYRSGLDRDGDGRACERNEGNGNDRDNARRDGRWDYNRDCRDDVRFRSSRADVSRWCDDWWRNNGGGRPTPAPVTTTETTTAQAPAPNIVVVPQPNVTTYGGSVPRGSINTGGFTPGWHAL